MWALDRRALTEYSFRCSCAAGGDLPAWMTTWQDGDGVRFRALTPKESPGRVRDALRAGTDAAPVPVPTERAVNAVRTPRHWTERD